MDKVIVIDRGCYTFDASAKKITILKKYVDESDVILIRGFRAGVGVEFYCGGSGSNTISIAYVGDNTEITLSYDTTTGGWLDTDNIHIRAFNREFSSSTRNAFGIPISEGRQQIINISFAGAATPESVSDPVLVGSGTFTNAANEAVVRLKTGVTAGSSVFVKSFEPIPYYAGRGGEGEFTAGINKMPVDGFVKYGLIDDANQNGFYLKHTTVTEFVILSDGVETPYTPNGDALDGGLGSKYVVNGVPTAFNYVNALPIFNFIYGLLGSAGCEVSTLLPRKRDYVPIHNTETANDEYNAIIQEFDLHIFMEVNNGTTAEDIELITSSWGGFIYTSEFNNLISSSNSVVKTMAISEVFTGKAIDTRGFREISASFFATNASATDGIDIQQSPDGVVWVTSDARFNHAGILEGRLDTTGTYGYRQFPIGVKMNYARIVYTNGALASDVIIQTILLKEATTAPVGRISDSISPDRSASKVKAFLAAEKDDGTQVTANPQSHSDANGYVSLATHLGARQAEAAGRGGVVVLSLEAATTSQTITTFPVGKTFWCTGYMAALENSSTAGVGELIVRENGSGGAMRIPIRIEEATGTLGTINKAINESTVFENNPLPFTVDAYADIVAGTLEFDIVLIGYYE